MKRTYSFIDENDEEQIIEIECCEGEAGQDGCYLKCQFIRCPLYMMAVDNLTAHDLVMEEARKLSAEGG